MWPSLNSGAGESVLQYRRARLPARKILNACTPGISCVTFIVSLPLHVACDIFGDHFNRVLSRLHKEVFIDGWRVRIINRHIVYITLIQYNGLRLSLRCEVRGEFTVVP